MADTDGRTPEPELKGGVGSAPEGKTPEELAREEELRRKQYETKMWEQEAKQAELKVRKKEADKLSKDLDKKPQATAQDIGRNISGAGGNAAVGTAGIYAGVALTAVFPPLGIPLLIYSGAKMVQSGVQATKAGVDIFKAAGGVEAVKGVGSAAGAVGMAAGKAGYAVGKAAGKGTAHVAKVTRNNVLGHPDAPDTAPIKAAAKGSPEAQAYLERASELSHTDEFKRLFKNVERSKLTDEQKEEIGDKISNALAGENPRQDLRNLQKEYSGKVKAGNNPKINSAYRDLVSSAGELAGTDKFAEYDVAKKAFDGQVVAAQEKGAAASPQEKAALKTAEALVDYEQASYAFAADIEKHPEYHHKTKEKYKYDMPKAKGTPEAETGTGGPETSGGSGGETPERGPDAGREPPVGEPFVPPVGGSGFGFEAEGDTPPRKPDTDRGADKPSPGEKSVKFSTPEELLEAARKNPEAIADRIMAGDGLDVYAGLNESQRNEFEGLGVNEGKLKQLNQMAGKFKDEQAKKSSSDKNIEEVSERELNATGKESLGTVDDKGDFTFDSPKQDAPDKKTPEEKGAGDKGDTPKQGSKDDMELKKIKEAVGYDADHEKQGKKQIDGDFHHVTNAGDLAVAREAKAPPSKDASERPANAEGRASSIKKQREDAIKDGGAPPAKPSASRELG